MFFPVNKQEMADRGYTDCDFILITGDAYVDHPSFGISLIGRVLEREGYKVGIIAQPDWKSTADFKKLGRPKLAFLVTGGNIDSMVNHYSVVKQRRDKDVYSPGGQMGLRPDRATIVYCNKIREAFKHAPIIIGGLEASLRRFAHYDYWDDAVRRSVLFDSGADLLVYGMGEKAILQIAEGLASHLNIKDITYVDGTCYMADTLEKVYEYEVIDSFETVKEDKAAYAQTFKKQMQAQDALRGKRLVQAHGNGFVVQNPPAMPLLQDELNSIYQLPFMRAWHPMYDKVGVPALEEVLFSLTSARGCYGGCAFCALHFHQGRVVQGRSHDSLIKEAEALAARPDFKGYIHDVGGPTANFRMPACKLQEKGGQCEDRPCMVPHICPNMKVSHGDYVNLLRKLRNIKGIKKVFVRSGIRFDYVMADKDDTFLRELVQHHISGQLKVAPEHVSDKVLDVMGKPRHEVYERFVEKYNRLNELYGKDQYLVPYLMSSHPGSDLQAAVELALYLKKIKYQPQQVQDFYPTPGTLSTCMFHTELNPMTMEKVYVPKSYEEKRMQRALLQFSRPNNAGWVRKALIACQRTDLIGYGPQCLVAPEDHRFGREKAPYTKRQNINRKSKR